MNFLKTAFTSSKAKSFYWQTANGFVLLLVSILSGIKPDNLDPVVIGSIAVGLALLNGITKHINKTYLTK